jgi:hypothetical protein
VAPAVNVPATVTVLPATGPLLFVDPPVGVLDVLPPPPPPPQLDIVTAAASAITITNNFLIPSFFIIFSPPGQIVGFLLILVYSIVFYIVKYCFVVDTIIDSGVKSPRARKAGTGTAKKPRCQSLFFADVLLINVKRAFCAGNNYLYLTGGF